MRKLALTARVSWKLLGPALAATLVGACTEQPSAPKVNRETIAADFTNNANGGGPNMLYRGTDGYSLVLNDGHYVVAFFPSPLIRCGHQFPIANEVAQYNGDLPGFFRLVVLGKQMNVYVLDLTEPTTCTVPSGSGAFVGWSEQGNLSGTGNEGFTEVVVPYFHASAYGFRGTATLTTPDGGQAHVTAVSQCLWVPGQDYTRKCTTKISVE